jgi:hypothetical protein
LFLWLHLYLIFTWLPSLIFIELQSDRHVLLSLWISN